MQFFDNGRGKFRPVDSIESMRKSTKDRSGGRVSGRIYYKDDPDRGEDIEDNTIDEILKITKTVVPAQPGFHLLTFGYSPEEADPEEPWINKEPVIAWRVSDYGGLDPVVIDIYFSELSEIHGILEPNGQVQTFDATFPDVDKWAADRKSAADADAERIRNRRDAEKATDQPQ